MLTLLVLTSSSIVRTNDGTITKFFTHTARGLWASRLTQSSKEFEIVRKAGRQLFQQEFPTRVYRRPRTLKELLFILELNPMFQSRKSELIFMRDGKDAWGRELKFESSSNNLLWIVSIRTAGADGEFRKSPGDASDDHGVILFGNIYAPITPATIQFRESDELHSPLAGKDNTPDFFDIPVADRKSPDI